jgi:hypothetical protein
MMKVKLLTSRAGVDFTQNVGDIIEVGASEGQMLLDSGQAEVVREEKIERAVKVTKEKAVK